MTSTKGIIVPNSVSFIDIKGDITNDELQNFAAHAQQATDRQQWFEIYKLIIANNSDIICQETIEVILGETEMLCEAYKKRWTRFGTLDAPSDK